MTNEELAMLRAVSVSETAPRMVGTECRPVTAHVSIPSEGRACDLCSTYTPGDTRAVLYMNGRTICWLCARLIARIMRAAAENGNFS